MKKSTAFGAVLCSAALAMGMALPSFAAGTYEVGNAGDFANGESSTATGSTTVSMTGKDAAQIAATVPVSVTVAVGANGGEITAPTPSAYQIINSGTADIYVKSVAAANLNETKYNMETATFTPDAVDATANPKTPAIGKGKFYLEVKGNNSVPVALKTQATETSAVDKAEWTAKANKGTISLELSGVVQPECKTAGSYVTISDTDKDPFARITYTVALVNPA